MTWDNVTIEKYLNIIEASKEDYTEPIDILNQNIVVASIITERPVREIEELDLEQLEKINKGLIHSPMPDKIKKRFKLNGIRYRATLDPKEIKGGKYVALMNISKRGALENLNHVMFILSKPQRIGFKKSFPFIGWVDYEFDATEIEDRIKDFKKLTMDVANPIAVFFCLLYQNLTNATLRYSEKKLTGLTKEMEVLLQDLKQNTDG